MLSLLLSGWLTLVSLNCENLFDCEHDLQKDDWEWTPDGANHWTRTRYWQKLNNIGREILACGEAFAPAEGSHRDADSSVVAVRNWQLPDLVALCEVENDSVLTDLTCRSLLRNARYKYVMTDSPDERGIDVALLYSPFTFRLVNSRSIRVQPRRDMRPTRDILYVEGELLSGEKLHVLVVHAPSRSGGEAATAPHRLLVAERLLQVVDSVCAVQPDARIVVAGDFNDYYRNRSIQRLEQGGLTDISRQATGSHGAHGTYRYRGEWGSLDHILVSSALTERVGGCVVFDAPFLLVDDQDHGGVKPRRNYVGTTCLRGFSDHLPLVARFCLPGDNL